MLASLMALALAMAAAPNAAAPAAPPAQPPVEDPVPAGLPPDDYGLVSWCSGALAGHMELYKMVKPELDALPDPQPKETAVLDAEQMKAGREYLALYKKATDAAERASPQNIAERGAQERAKGAGMWNPAREADPKTRMWTYLGWELPGRCETAAERLYEKSLLSAQALGIDIVPTSSGASGQTVTPQLEAPVAK
jgi:hypothetical protein